MKTYQPIAEIKPLGHMTLDIVWQDGVRSTVDLSEIIATSRHLAPLAKPALFASARRGDQGFSIEWDDDIDLSAAQLWRCAGEQSGELMSAEAFTAWRKRNGLTLDRAAGVLGLSRRLVAYYDSGEKPIPRTVRLATIGHETEQHAA